MGNLSLLSSTSRIEVPFVKVTIGKYTFGVYGKTTERSFDEYGVYTLNKIRYPNYIKSLRVQKINGAVNKYTLDIEYVITEENDPNYFEKVLGNVRDTRQITFSYGDTSVPTYVFRNEEALITKVTKRFNISASLKTFTITAVSNANNISVGAYTFEDTYDKPSNIIKELLYNNQQNGLLEVFYGMTDKALVEQEGLIRSDDKRVHLEKKTNMSILDYLTYLVDCMQLSTEPDNVKKTFYHLTVMDDTSGLFKGPYFKITASESNSNNTTAYDITIGLPNSMPVVLELNEETDETYNILYNFNEELNNEKYVRRINNRGEIEEVYAPIVNSFSPERILTNDLKNWWNNVTEFPTKINIKIKGLLRPAMLMSYVNLNVLFYGKKDTISGLYIVTKEVDTIDASGYNTVLSLTRINGSSYENVV